MEVGHQLLLDAVGLGFLIKTPESEDIGTIEEYWHSLWGVANIDETPPCR